MDTLAQFAGFLVCLQVAVWLIIFVAVSVDRKYGATSPKSVLGYFIWSFFWIPLFVLVIKEDWEKEIEWKKLRKSVNEV